MIASRHFCCLALLLICTTFSACGGGSSEGSNFSPPAPSAPADVPPPSSSPEPSLQSVGPVIANPPPVSLTVEMDLLGEAVVYLDLGDEYIEMGAAAFDRNEGDISFSIEIEGAVDTSVAADYLLKYSATDDDRTGEAIRIVRVQAASPVRQTQRLNTSTGANLSYLEHLPTDYATDMNLKAPLIIFNHGSGATGSGQLSDVECCGLAGVLDFSSWDDSLPFVVLSPHRNSGLDYDELNEFVDFVLEHYAVDPDRIYITGWSQGAYISILYAIAYPEKVKALAPLAGGLFGGIPENICDASGIPMWMYLGGQDSSTINNAGKASFNALEDCQNNAEKRLTTFSTANHFNASIWPFLPEGNRQIDSDSDAVTQDLLQWFLLQE